jgi:two-component system NtrC family sensor kinase
LAHELNTPAQYLSDNLSFLSEAFDELLGGVDAAQSPRWPDALEYLKKEIPSSLNDMREGVFKIASIVSTIAEFAEADSQRVTNIDLARTIDNVVELLRSRWLGVVELSTHHSSQVHNVHCGPVDLKHALWQLIAQAVDEASTHGEGRGRVDIATRRDEGAVTISVRASRPARKHPDTVPPPNTDALKLTRAVLHRQHAELTRHVDQDSATSVIKLPA